MSIDVVDVVRRIMDAWNSGDVEGIVALAHQQPFATLMEFDDGLFIRGRSWFDLEEAFRAAAALAQSGDPP